MLTYETDKYQLRILNHLPGHEVYIHTLLQGMGGMASATRREMDFSHVVYKKDQTLIQDENSDFRFLVEIQHPPKIGLKEFLRARFS